MPTIVERSVSILLKAIRTRRPSPDADAPASAVTPSDGANGVRQRELRFHDFVDNWHRLWRNSPAIRSAKSYLPMGWVLEADNKIVGYLGSIPLLYHFGDKPLLAAAASGFLVEPAYRTFGKDLVASFYSQPNIDLFLSTTAESVGRLAKALEVETLPQENYATVLFWVLDARHFADAVLWKLGATGGTRSLAGMLGSL